MAEDRRLKRPTTQLILSTLFLRYCAPLLILSIATTAHTTDVDLSIYVSDYAGSEGQYVYITNNPENADEKWYIASTCSRKPDVAVYISHMPVAMEQYVFISKTAFNVDKLVCITNVTDLDKETLRLLKISDETNQ